MAAAARLARSPRARAPLAAAAAGGLVLLLSAPAGGLASTAARAALAAAALGAGAALVRRRARPSGAAPAIRLLAREALARDTGVALVEVEGRRLLVGFGPQGVQLLAAPAGEEARS